MVPVWLHQALMNYLKGLPCGDFLPKYQNFSLGMGVSLSKTKKSAESAASAEKENCLVAEVSGVDKE